MGSTDRFRSRRYLLEPAVSSTANDVAVVADKLRWPLVGQRLGDDESLLGHEVVWGKNDGLNLRYQQDALSRSPGVCIMGGDERQVLAASRIVLQALNPATLEELLDASDALAYWPADFMLALLRLGFGAPVEFDDRFFERIQGALRHSLTEVRYASVWATFHTRWPQFEPLLVRAAQDDLDEVVRHAATRVLGGWRADHEDEPVENTSAAMKAALLRAAAASGGDAGV
jgi:hypothetical protein